MESTSHPTRATAVLFAAALASLGSAPHLPAQAPPNVVLVLVDDLGWRDLGCTGNPVHRTPNLDRLAAGGMRFTRCYAGAAVCSPTRAALQTGKNPARLGITDWIRASFQPADPPPPGVTHTGYRERLDLRPAHNVWQLDGSETTIAEVLATTHGARGYVGKWHLGRQTRDWPRNQGYTVNHGGCDFGQPPSYFDPYENRRVDGIPTLPARTAGQYLTDREADEIEGFVRGARTAGVPFFLMYAPYAVHTPIQAKDEVTARYRERIAALAEEEGADAWKGTAKYAAMVESVDDAVGRLLRTLEATGADRDTLVVFTSDNGGLTGPTDNRPLRAGKGWPYEGGIRVPGIAWWPGHVPAGRVCDVPVTSADWMPTISGLVARARPGATAPRTPEGIDGLDLSPVLLGNRPVTGPAVERTLAWHFPHVRSRRIGPFSVLLDGRHKLVRWWRGPEAGGNRHELYDLAADPSESEDLSDAAPERLRALAAELDAWLERTGARVPLEGRG